jgi:hypothetical protein
MLHFFTHVIEQYGDIAVVTLVTAEGAGIPLLAEPRSVISKP